MTTTLTGISTNCRGANHCDSGTYVECATCGALAVAVAGKSLRAVRMRTMGPSGYYCWVAHECNERAVELHSVVVAEAILRGEPAVGVLVEVVKGRKVAVGTTGVVVRISEGAYGTRVAMSVADTAGLVWTAATNMRVTDAEALADAQATVEAHAAKHAGYAEREAAAAAVAAEWRALLADGAPGERGSTERLTWWETVGEPASKRYEASLDDLAAIKAERGW